MSIVNTPEEDFSNVDRKYDMIKICTSSSKLSTTFFSIRAMYNRVNCAQKQRLALRSYIIGVISSIFPKRNYDNFFSE